MSAHSRSLIAALLVAVSISGLAASRGTAAAAALPALNACSSSDHGNPVLTALTVSHARVDVRRRSQTVVVDATLPDTGGPGPSVGTFGARLVVTHLKAAATIQTQMIRVAGDLWRGRVVFPRGSQPGRWTFSVWPFDAVGNQRGSAPEPLTRAVRVVSLGDRRAPVLDRIHLSRTSVDALSAHRRVFVSVVAHDPGSGVAAVTLSVKRSGVFGLIGDVPLHLVSGTARSGRWRGHFDFPLWTPGGTWTTGVSLTDRTGRSVGYGSALAVSRRRVPKLPALRVRSRTDTAPPLVTAIDASPSAIDLRAGPATVAIELRLRDVASGVASASAWIERNLLPEFEVPLTLVAGNRADGLWRGTWSATTCAVAAGLRKVQVVARDRAGNQLRSPVDDPSITVVNDDHTPPFPNGDHVTATEVIVFFSEDVVNVTPRSLVLFDLDHNRRPKPPFAGHWTCQTAAGTQVDCLTGPVRQVSFVPDRPMTTFYHQLQINPEHVLDITDLSGNAARAETPVGLPPKSIP
jgi:hypothetical protein